MSMYSTGSMKAARTFFLVRMRSPIGSLTVNLTMLPGMTSRSGGESLAGLTSSWTFAAAFEDEFFV